MPGPILLTGISGFIAKRVALDLLNAGHDVRGSLRNPDRQSEVRAALEPHLSDPAALDRLTFVTLDLGDDTGWETALEGASVLVHTASPFPMAQPKDENDVIRPAVDGTLRALHAAQSAGVTRVVMTSSVVAIEACDKPDGQAYTEADWSDPNHPIATPYYKSKMLAERAAWDFVAQHPEMQLTTINPALVLGTPLDKNYGTSLQVVERILSGKDPMMPDLRFGLVDVADVSAAHIAALQQPDSAGRRFIAAGETVSMPEMAAHLKARYPNRKISTRVAPSFVLRILALFDPAIRTTVLPNLGRQPVFDNSAAQQELGVSFTPWQTALDRAGDAVMAKT